MINRVRTEFEVSLAGARVDAIRELQKNGHRLTCREQVELDTMVAALEDYRTNGWREARDAVVECQLGEVVCPREDLGVDFYAYPWLQVGPS